MRKYGKWLLILGVLAGSPGWVSAEDFQRNAGQSLSVLEQQQRNQRKAEQVGSALRAARINGYDMVVDVQGGAVKLEGKVRDITHKALAERACRSVAGIDHVVNNLKYVPPGQVQQTSGQVDSGLRPAVYSSDATSDSDVSQVHFQKPGKTTRESSTTRSLPSFSNPFSRFMKSRSESAQSTTTTQRKSVTQTTKQVAAQPKPATASQPKPVAAAEPKPVAKKPAAVQPNPFAEAASFAQPKAVAQAKPLVQPKPAAASTSTEATKTAARPEPKPQMALAAAPAAPKQEIPLPPAVPPSARSAASQFTTVSQSAPVVNTNQEVAQDIAISLAKVGLVGYDVEIRYEDGVATLNGEVATVQQQRNAAFAASQVTGVNDVRNNLQVKGPIAQASFQPQAAPVRPAAMMMPAGAMVAPAAAMAGAAPSPIAGAGNYSNPNLPSHAWPAYAAYPNSAAITYPKQYSPSAWPYIGPFYPYPQVPLGWREVSLQWDDGHWQLDFEKKHKSWYWLWRPANWGLD